MSRAVFAEASVSSKRTFSFDVRSNGSVCMTDYAKTVGHGTFMAREGESAPRHSPSTFRTIENRRLAARSVKTAMAAARDGAGMGTNSRGGGRCGGGWGGGAEIGTQVYFNILMFGGERGGGGV